MQSINGNIYFGEAAKETGPFSGKEKYRLQIAGQELHGHFAIALKSGEIKNNYLDVKSEWNITKSKDWVPLRTDHGIVRAEVASIATRLGISKKDILKFVNNDNLESKIKERVLEYDKINRLRPVIENFLNTWNPDNLVSCYDNKSFIENIINDLKEKINHPLLKRFLHALDIRSQKIRADDPEFVRKMTEGLNSFTSKIEYFQKPPSPLREKIFPSTGKNEESVKQKEISNMELFLGNAMPLPDSKGTETARISLCPDKKIDAKDKFAVATDGYIYYERPPNRYLKPSARYLYVPYSADGGRTWLLLNKASLSKRLSIDPKVIDKAVKGDRNGEQLKKLINEQIKNY